MLNKSIKVSQRIITSPATNAQELKSNVRMFTYKTNKY
jgi:hypothetical protein